MVEFEHTLFLYTASWMNDALIHLLLPLLRVMINEYPESLGEDTNTHIDGERLTAGGHPFMGRVPH